LPDLNSIAQDNHGDNALKIQLLTLLAAGMTLAAPLAAHAQTPGSDWPNKPIRWVIPFPPGGAMDAIARTLGEKAGKSLGQPFVIDNKPGAGGNIGADFVAKAPADGYTLMITSIGMATNKPLYGKLSYDPVKDFAPVSLLAVVPNVLVTNSTQPNIKTVTDLIATAKKEPGKLTYASAGNGTSIHLAGEVFTSLAKIDMLHVPYKGSGPAVADLLGGQVNYMFDSITSARPHIQSGKLRALGVTTAKLQRLAQCAHASRSRSARLRSVAVVCCVHASRDAQTGDCQAQRRVIGCHEAARCAGPL
jgi:tripartite-type tricarboxylate transporter receptor subunit TctC